MLQYKYKYEYVVKSEKLHTFKTQNIENRMLAHYTLYICIIHHTE